MKAVVVLFFIQFQFLGGISLSSSASPSLYPNQLVTLFDHNATNFSPWQHSIGTYNTHNSSLIGVVFTTKSNQVLEYRTEFPSDASILKLRLTDVVYAGGKDAYFSWTIAYSTLHGLFQMLFSDNVIQVFWSWASDSQSAILNSWNITNSGVSQRKPVTIELEIQMEQILARFYFDDKVEEIRDVRGGMVNFTGDGDTVYIQTDTFSDHNSASVPESFVFGFRSESAAFYADSFFCESRNSCGKHGQCLQNPNFVATVDVPKSRNDGYFDFCLCDIGYSGIHCDKFTGVQAAILNVYRAQSGSTAPGTHLEEIFDMRNANAAFLATDGEYACSTKKDFVVVQYQIKVDTNFQNYLMCNQDSCEFFNKNDFRVGYSPQMKWLSFPEQSQCKSCEELGTNNCRWKVISVEKIVESQCLLQYADRNGSSCEDPNILEAAFEYCPPVNKDSSKSWIKGPGAPSHCPRVISGCVGDTFPAISLSESGCAHQCISCSRRSELAFPSSPEIESISPTGIAVSWDLVNSTLYGDPLPVNTASGKEITVTYISTLTRLDDGLKAFYPSNLPTLAISNLFPARNYSLVIKLVMET